MPFSARIRSVRTRAGLASFAVVVAVPLTYVVTLVGAAVLTIPFLEHDARGMPVEPRWIGWLAFYGGTALVTALMGYGLGLAAGFRWLQGLVTGGATGVALCNAWYVKETLRGYEPGAEAALSGLLVALLCTAPFTAWGARVGSAPG
jgi:hypothetical protein